MYTLFAYPQIIINRIGDFAILKQVNYILTGLATMRIRIKGFCFGPVILTILALWLIFQSAFGDDFYLIEIRGENELTVARQVVNHANGIFENRFIVNLDESQRQLFKRAGIKPEIIAENIPAENLYLITRNHPSPTGVVLDLSPLYSSDHWLLVKWKKFKLVIARSHEVPQKRDGETTRRSLITLRRDCFILRNEGPHPS